MAVFTRIGVARPRGPFAFPAISPGFNQAHVAAINTRLSAVLYNGSANRLDLGKVTASTGPLPSAIDGCLGSSLTNNFTGGRHIPVLGCYAGAETEFTAAALFRPLSVAGNNYCVANNNTTTGTPAANGLVVNSSAQIQFLSYNGTSRTSSFTLSAGVPYFIVISGNSAATNFLALNLLTGVIQTSSTGAPTFVSSTSGTCRIGARPDASTDFFNGNLAAVMISGRYLSLPQMNAWAADPWAFWYPR